MNTSTSEHYPAVASNSSSGASQCRAQEFITEFQSAYEQEAATQIRKRAGCSLKLAQPRVHRLEAWQLDTRVIGSHFG